MNFTRIARQSTDADGNTGFKEGLCIVMICSMTVDQQSAQFLRNVGKMDSARITAEV